MSKTRNEYIHRLARTLAGQWGIHAEDWVATDSWPADAREYAMKHVQHPFYCTSFRRTLARALWFRYHTKVEGYVIRLSDEKKGQLAACGVGWDDRPLKTTTMLDVRDGVLLLSASGDTLISVVASLALLAAMTDNLIADLRKMNTDVDLTHV